MSKKIEAVLNYLDEALATFYLGSEAALNPELVFHPEIEFKPAVEGQVAHIEDLIRACDDKRSKSAEKLVSYSTHSDPEDCYVRGMAMRQVLGHYGLLGIYDWSGWQYGEAANSRIFRGYKETFNGWTLQMTVPRNASAAFKVVDIMSKKKVKDDEVDVERWSFYYIARQ